MSWKTCIELNSIFLLPKWNSWNKLSNFPLLLLFLQCRRSPPACVPRTFLGDRKVQNKANFAQNFVLFLRFTAKAASFGGKAPHRKLNWCVSFIFYSWRTVESCRIYHFFQVDWAEIGPFLPSQQNRNSIWKSELISKSNVAFESLYLKDYLSSIGILN